MSVEVKTSVPSGTAIIVVSSTTSDNSIVVVPGANYTVDKEHVDGIEMIYLDDKDVIRHRLVSHIIKAFKSIESE